MGYAFDGTAKRISLTAGTVSIELADLYSRWKDWVLAGNAGFLPAFSTVGGDIPAIPLYLFLENGWRIVPQAADHALTVRGGVLEVQGGGDPFVDPVGDHKIRINRQAPGIAIGYSTTGVSGPSAAEIAAEMLALLMANTIPVDTRLMNGAPVVGTGVEADPWRGSDVSP
jgi:hypothetical protein